MASSSLFAQGVSMSQRLCNHHTHHGRVKNLHRSIDAQNRLPQPWQDYLSSQATLPLIASSWSNLVISTKSSTPLLHRCHYSRTPPLHISNQSLALMNWCNLGSAVKWHVDSPENCHLAILLRIWLYLHCYRSFKSSHCYWICYWASSLLLSVCNSLIHLWHAH